MADAHAERNQHEGEAGGGNRVLLLPRHDLVVRVDVLLPKVGHLGFELGDGHFRGALHGTGARKHALGIDHEHRLLERALLVFHRLVEVHGVMRAVDQHHLHGALRLVEQQTSLFCKIRFRLRRRAALRYHHISPAHAGSHFPYVNDQIRKIRVEHARFDFGFAARHQQLERDLAERLICGRQRDDHDVGRRGCRDQAEEQQRTQQTAEADAARLHRDDLAVARKAAERDEDADEQRHRDGYAQRLRQEGRKHPDDDVP